MEVDLFEDEMVGALPGDLLEWVMGKCQDWRDHYKANYKERHDEYMRLFRNEWAEEDKTRKSERSKLIAPALAQAVESNVAEVEEATFGRGKIFDIKDDSQDEETDDVTFLRTKLHEDFELARVRSANGEALINAAVYGTGIGEIVLDEITTYTPATRDVMEGGMKETGVSLDTRVLVKLNPIQPKNFLIDEAASCIEDALGCAVDEYVSRHIVEELQESGVYRNDEFVGEAAPDKDIEFDDSVDSLPRGRVRLLKYYGKVPRSMLLAEGVAEEEIKEPGHYVEAIVVIANDGVLLKAVPSPYMCKDRPIVAFQWDVVPGSFWGRGVCEKGYMSQKALDAELRARIDALALTTHPMMAVDATKIPRGHKLEVRPGRMLLVNGPPRESIEPFNFGQLNAVTFQQGAALQQMVAQAAGAADGSMPQVQNDVTAAGMSMSQGGIMKRQKRTLVNYQENFLIQFVKKAAWRYMQYAPDIYPVSDYNFVPFSSLGAMAREYEVAQLSQIMQVLGDNPAAQGAITNAIVEHLNVSNRDQIITAINEASQPNPEQQKMEQEAAARQNAILEGQANLLNSQAAESKSRADKYNEETRLAAPELVLKHSDTNNDGVMDADFRRRVELAQLMLAERDMNLREAESQRAGQAQEAEAQLIRELNNMGGPNVPAG